MSAAVRAAAISFAAHLDVEAAEQRDEIRTKAPTAQ